MGKRLRRRKDDHRAARQAHPPLPHPGNRKRQLPLQEQLGQSAQNIKGETQELDPNQQHERYLKAGQFSVETPGQLSVEINKLVNRSVTGQLGGSIEYDWSADGIVVVLKLKGEKLAK